MGRSRSPRPAPARSTTGWRPDSSWSATWLSGSWVKAFAEEYSNIYYLDAARREQVITRWRGESEKYVRFFVALYVPEEKGNDLEKPETLWSLRIVRADEKDFEPVYIRKSSLRPEEISRFFPYSGTWYRAYEVAFRQRRVSSRVAAGRVAAPEAGPVGRGGARRPRLAVVREIPRWRLAKSLTRR